MAVPKLNNGEWMALLAASELAVLGAPMDDYLESARTKIREAMTVELVDPPVAAKEGDSDR